MKMAIEQLRVSTAVLGLSIVFGFTGCVKQHDKRAGQSDLARETRRYAIQSNTLPDKKGTKVQALSGMYQTETEYLGCEPVAQSLAVGSLTSTNKVVVKFSEKKMACVRADELETLKERPPVELRGSLGTTPYWIQTRKVLRKSGRTESLEGVDSDKGTGINFLDFVSYSTNSPLLNAVADRLEVRALPGKQYKVYHKIAGKVLYIMMVVPKGNMGHLDFSLSDNLGNGEYAVPLAWADIRLLKQELMLNADNEKTNVIVYNEVEVLSEATHIDLNISNLNEVKLTQFSNLKDIYPTDYFTKGQWYFSESVVDTRPGSEGFIGTTTGAFDTSFRSAVRIQFTVRTAGLVACNVSIDQRYSGDLHCDRSDSVLTIPGNGIAYGLFPNSGLVKAFDVQPSKAPYFTLKLNSIISVRKSIDELFSVIRDTNQDQVIKVNFYKNKFSFITQRGANGRRIMYSFLRVEGRTPYVARRHYKNDRQSKFGYFVQTVSKIRSSDVVAREEDLEKDYLIQRHNPAKNIVFHFSNLTPNYKKNEDPYKLEIDYRKIGRKSIEYWNKVYERTGSPNRVVLGEGDVPFGDIGYNTMNLIDSEKGSNLLGVGPSLVDPYSGEVINANANVYIAPFREIVAERVRNYIKAKTGLLDKAANQLPVGAGENSTLLGDMTFSASGIKNLLSTIFPKNVMVMAANFYHHNAIDFTTEKIHVDEYGSNSDEVVDLYSLTKFNFENSMVQNLIKVSQRIPEMIFLRDRGDITFSPRSRKDVLNLQQALEAYRPTFYRSYFMSDSALGSDYNPMTGQIEEKCGEVLKLVTFVNNRAESEGTLGRLTTEEELPALRHCMTQLIPVVFQWTLIHEIGHTLGLRHNFKASSDKDNFFNKEEVKELYGLDVQDHNLPKSSSVMDYIRIEQNRLMYPGHYDIAAIRYGYANAVEVESSAKRPNSLNGNYVKLDQGDVNRSNGSIIGRLDGKHTVKPFGYCTDIEASLEIDPLCARHDFGVNPKMIVEDTINSFWESFVLYNFKYDRRGPSVNGPFGRASGLRKLKRMYTEWRVHLANYLGKEDSTGNVYLQRYNRIQYEALLKKLKADPNFKGKDYLAVRDQIFDFIMDVAFFPNKYCLVQTPIGLKAYEFSKLRDELKNQVPRKTKISSCEDNYMQSLIQSKGYVYYYEAGLPVDNLWYSVNPQDTFEEGVYFSSLRAPLDIVGSFLDRYFASIFLSGRNAGYTGVLEKMFPNMMDEPDLYEKFEERMVKRLTKGVDVRNAFERANKVILPPEEVASLVLPNFDAESALLKALWLSLEQGIRNQFVDNSVKISKYTRQITTEESIIRDAQNNGGFVMPLDNGSVLVVRPEARVAFSLAKALVEIIQKFQFANEPIPTADQLKNGLQSSVLEVSNSLKVEAGAQISVEQYLKFARTFNNIMSSHPLKGLAFEKAYLNELSPYFVFLKRNEDIINQAKAAGEKPPLEAVEAVKSIEAEWTAKGMDGVIAETQAWLNANGYANILATAPTEDSVLVNFTLVEEEIIAGIQRVTKARDKERAYLEINGNELFAQYDLLKSILIYDYSQIGTDFQIRLEELFGSKGEDTIRDLSKNSRADVRFFAQKYLNPNAIARAKWGIKFPFR